LRASTRSRTSARRPASAGGAAVSPPQLLLDVQRRLPPALASRVLRLEHLADLLLLLGLRGGRGDDGGPRRVGVADVQPAAADLVVEVGPVGERGHRRDDRHDHHDEDDDTEGFLHRATVCP